jgi:hypothetical protein
MGFDSGNYDYSLTLDGVHDEDVREIYAYGTNEIEGNIMLDARENSKITLIDLAGDTYTTGGIDGDSNIFVTYDDELEILGGDNDDDVDVTLDSDIEDGEFQFDGGGDDEDTLNVNLNGDEIDTRGYGRSIDHVEYIDIDAPDGDGEAHLHFDGSGTDMSDIVQVDVSDVKDDSSLTLDGDLSAFDTGATNLGLKTGAPAIVAAATKVDGFVADQDVSIKLTAADDIVTAVIGESTIVGGGGATQANILAGTANGAAAGAQTVSGSQEVRIDLGGGDDIVSLVLGAAQTEDVTFGFARANSDDHDTVQIDLLEDLAVLGAGASGVRLDFQDDVSKIIDATAGGAAAAAVNVAGSQHGAVLVFDSTGQKGFIYDHDGDGKLSDGDTLVDMTDAVTAVAVVSGNMRVTTDGTDQFDFALSGGDLIDIA